MFDPWTLAAGILTELCRSDVGDIAPSRAYLWLAVGVAHIGMGMAVALSPFRRFAAVLLLVFIARELACDLRHDGFALLTWLDSVFDTAMVAFGFAWATRAIEARPFLNDGKTSRGC